MPQIHENILIPEHLSGERLDVAVAELLPEFSRSRLQRWIQEGHILLDGKQVKAKSKVVVDQELVVDVEIEAVDDTLVAEDIPLDILYEDASIIVLNKPADLVVHPAAGHPNGTLQNALLFHDAALAEVPRAGIIHRLDKDTTGIMVVARTLQAHNHLVDRLQRRDIKREYQALLQGVLTGGGKVDAALGRHPHDRKRMTIREDGKPAVTHYRLIERFRNHTHVLLELESGRTHQIRVHMQSIRHPVVGDPVYGGRSRKPAGASEGFIELLEQFKRQALHAYRLTLEHPETHEEMSWEAPLPQDMRALIEAMQQDASEHDA